ncbi:MAG: hypothetical protein K0S11_1884 [Gammaproteobacteria bacterium]|jgi:hypothetical protein|nr:hypothetical protein [Gammaproteobacteria bacterium]
MGYQTIAQQLRSKRPATNPYQKSMQDVTRDINCAQSYFNEQLFKLEPNNSFEVILAKAGITDPLLKTYLQEEAHQNGFLNIASGILVTLPPHKGYSCNPEIKRYHFTTIAENEITYTEEFAIFIAQSMDMADELSVKATMAEIEKAKGDLQAFLKVSAGVSPEIVNAAEQDLAIFLDPKANESKVAEAYNRLERGVSNNELTILKPLIYGKASYSIKSKENASGEQVIKHSLKQAIIKPESDLGANLISDEPLLKDEPLLMEKLITKIKDSINSLVTKFNNWIYGQNEPTASHTPSENTLVP